MKLIWRVLRVMVLSCVILTSVFVIGNVFPGSSATNQGSGLNLVKPAFAQTSEASFLEQEAGIAAYVNVGKTLDLGRAKSAYRTVEKETQNYIVGSVSLPSYEAREDAHLYVQKDGWIVAYYGKGEPTSKIVDWLNYSPGKINTKLRLGLDKMATALGLAITKVNYYHFGYPTANQLVVMAGQNFFTYTIPPELVVYEGSPSYYMEANKSPYITNTYGGFINNAPQFKKEVRHSAGISITYGSGWSANELTAYFYVDDSQLFVFGKTYGAIVNKAYIAVVIIYQE